MLHKAQLKTRERSNQTVYPCTYHVARTETELQRLQEQKQSIRLLMKHFPHKVVLITLRNQNKRAAVTSVLQNDT